MACWGPVDVARHRGLEDGALKRAWDKQWGIKSVLRWRRTRALHVAARD